MKVWEHLRTRGSSFNLYLSLVNDASDRTRLIMDLLFALLIFSLGIYIEVSPFPVSSSVNFCQSEAMVCWGCGCDFVSQVFGGAVQPSPHPHCQPQRVCGFPR